MKNLGYILTLVMSVNVAFAQIQSQDISGNTQLPAASAPAAVSQSTTVQVQAQAAPTTYVEASPLVESRAEQLRKQREAAELNTEMMIVEQLEKDRIEAERRRAQKLFGEKLQDEQVVAAPVVVAPAATAVVVPEVVPAVQNEAVQQDISELKSMVQELKTTPVVEEKGGVFNNGKVFFGVNAGISEYNANNIKTNLGAAGASIGMEFNDGFIVEASYAYSTYDIQSIIDGRLLEMTQNNISGAVKYRLLDGRISPIVGGVISYTMRDYQEKYYNPYMQDVSSQAIDLGLYAGASIAISENFSIGLDLTYMFNLSNKIDENSGYYYSAFNDGFSEFIGGKQVEEINYYILGVSASLKF